MNFENIFKNAELYAATKEISIYQQFDIKCLVCNLLFKKYGYCTKVVIPYTSNTEELESIFRYRIDEADKLFNECKKRTNLKGSKSNERK